MAWSNYTNDMLVAGIATRSSVIRSIDTRKDRHGREDELRTHYLEDIRTMQLEQRRRYAVKLESAA